MNKSDLVDAIVHDAGLSLAEAGAALNSLIAAIQNTLSGGGEVRITDFGTFKVVERKARTGRNPHTGEAINIPAKKVPKFSASSNLKSELED